MANLQESAKWENGIYRIELTDPVVGGEDGIDNIQAKQLGNRTLYLKAQLDAMKGTVDGYAPDMQEALFAGLKLGLDLASLAMKEHEQTRLARFQELRALVKNRGVKSGVTLTKSTNATRNISCSDGVVFMDGREYAVSGQTNTASVASNTTEKAGIVIIYMFKGEHGVIDVAATTLNGSMPEGAIELARATVPAGNTEENDQYLSKVTITDSARREPGWPSIQKAPATVSVALNRTLPDADYIVVPEILSCTGGGLQVGEARIQGKLKNGFKVVVNGTADNVDVKLLVARPSL